MSRFGSLDIRILIAIMWMRGRGRGSLLIRGGIILVRLGDLRGGNVWILILRMRLRGGKEKVSEQVCAFRRKERRGAIQGSWVMMARI